MDAVIDEARRLEVERVFTLTYERGFFARMGFEVVGKDSLPSKVWSVCIKCPKRHGCDEIAMVRRILEGPAVAEPSPEEDAGLRYEVPTPLIQVTLPPGMGKK